MTWMYHTLCSITLKIDSANSYSVGEMVIDAAERCMKIMVIATILMIFSINTYVTHY